MACPHKVDDALVQVGNATLVPGAPTDRDTDPGQATSTHVHVAVDGQFIGTIALADTVRPSARRCVDDLHSMGLRVVMLTGDSQATGLAVAAQLGIDNVRTDLLPGDKLAAIDAERAVGHKVAMVGDGVNDAPALARATVGIAMGSGTEVARQSADIVLISSDLTDLTRTVQVARRTRGVVKANFVGTIAIDLVGMVLAAFGLLGPVLAAIIHVGSESAFILISARLIPGRRADRSRVGSSSVVDQVARP